MRGAQARKHLIFIANFNPSYFTLSSFAGSQPTQLSDFLFTLHTQSLITNTGHNCKAGWVFRVSASYSKCDVILCTVTLSLSFSFLRLCKTYINLRITNSLIMQIFSYYRQEARTNNNSQKQCWITDQMDKDDYEDLKRDYQRRPKQVNRGLTRGEWWRQFSYYFTVNIIIHIHIEQLMHTVHIKPWIIIHTRENSPTCFNDKSSSSGTQHKGIQNQHAQFTHIIPITNNGSRKDKNVGTIDNGMTASSWIKFKDVPLFILYFFVRMVI